jgi:hypothetical protein
MALLRDVLARFSVLVDDKPLTKLDKRIEKLKENVKKFAGYAAIGFTGVAVGAYKLVDAASNAAESLNVLQQTFGANADAVVAWSKTMGKELGRSEYTLQDSVGKFGAFLQPVFEGSNQDIATMSKRLSGLAVDLASFYNTSDEEAQMRLFSGVSGETEAVRRLGIDISDTSLSDFNHKRGDSRNLALLTLQEKTVLRMEKIFQDTTKKQGDAARTAEQWANSVRRLQDQVKTLAVRMGKVLIGPATKLLHWAEKMVEAFETMTLRTSTWQAAFSLASAIGLGYGARWLLLHKDLVKWADLLNKEFWMLNLKVLGVVAAFLLLEDLWTMMRGGKSVTGDFITMMTGIQKPAELVTAIFEKLALHIHNAFNSLGNIARLIPKLLTMTGAEWTKFDFGAFITEGNLDKTRSEGDAEARDKLGQSAVASGDIKGYKAAMRSSGLSDEEILSNWKRDRTTAISTGKAQATDADYADGLIKAPDYATYSDADRSRMQGAGVHGNKTTTVNVNVPDPGASAEKIGAKVKEVLDERDRQEAAALAEESDYNGGV